ncbi:DUF58 domain-containing protein [Metabacillus indicus]|uniref:DUF58 domain-containing protein n=1 Tax=Metabacillus indicus TaxID=246786 RepID=UPI000493AA72|nr:DUF58 domain-containing protein [Metabacillus indicus]KEZ49514.1 hypothetical protein AZ46_0213390 [Metabacillus indicus LMG 22858]
MKSFFLKIRYVWKLVSLLFFTAVTFAYAMFQGGFVSWFLFYSFMPISLYSLLVALCPLRTFEVTRAINQEQFSVGEKLIGTITIERAFPFPLFYLVVEDVLPEKLSKLMEMQEPKKLLYPWFKKKIIMSYELSRMPRGEHRFTQVRVRTGDLFGLIDKEVTFDAENYFLVYPHSVDLSYRQNEKQFEQGAASSKAKFWQDTTMAIGIRDYQPGDRFSWIDWKSTARRDRIMTKEFEQMQSHDVVVMMDRTPSDVFEEIVTFSASLAKSIIKSGAKLGFVSIGSEKSIFSIGETEQHLQQIYYHLAKTDCDSGTSFAEIAETELPVWQSKNATPLLVTSALSLDLVRKLERLGSRSHATLVFLVKKEGERITSEEKVMMDRLIKRKIITKAVGAGRFEEAFKEVSML